MKKLIDIIEEGKTEKESISTGFKQLDKLTKGFRKSDLVYIAARPAMGKTTFAVNLAENIAATGKECVFFSLDLSAEHLAKKFSTINSDIEIYIEDQPVITVSEIKQKVVNLKDVDCVIIDDFGLITPEIKRTNRMQECHDISRDLKRMVKELNIPVICTTSLPRQVDVDKQRPTLSSFFGLYSLVQDANIIMFLYRDSYYFDSIDEDDINNTELIIAKNCHGDIGTIELEFDREAIRFTDKNNLIIDEYEICYP